MSKSRKIEQENDPFAEGMEAFYSGKSDSQNPYPCPSDDHLSWNDGYNSAAEAQK